MNKDIWVIILLFLVAAAISLLLYRPRKEPFTYTLRTLAAFFLLLFLWNPASEKITQRQIKPSLNLLIDYSLSTRDYEKYSDSLAKRLAEDKTLAKKFAVHTYYFTDSLYNAKPEKRGKYTDIYQALEKINETGNRKTKQAAVLLTDGNITKGRDYVQAASSMPYLKIFPVVTGDTARRPNLKIEQTDFNPVVNKGNFFFIKTRIVAENIRQDTETELVIKKKNKTVFRKKIRLSPSKNFAEITAKFQALRPGMQSYRIEIRPLENEKQPDDNVKNIWINVVENKARVLILYGKIHPDIGAVHRVLTKSENYDVEIKNHVPAGTHYDLIICVQPQAAQLKALEKTKTPVWWITGIHTDWQAVNKAGLLFRRQTVDHLTEDYFAVENPNFSLFEPPAFPSYSLPPLRDLFGEIRPDASVEILYYAKIKTEVTRQALWAFFPQHKQAATFGQGIWKWYLYEKSKQDTEHIESLINKTVSYLISTPSTSQLIVHARQQYTTAAPVRINISAYNRLMELNPSARLDFKLFLPDGKVKSIPLFYKEPYFTADLGILPPGDYTYEVVYKDYGLRRKGGFTVIPEKIEPEKPADTEGLKILAQASGGKMFYPGQTEELLSYFRNTKDFPVILKEEKKRLRLTDRWIWLLLFTLVMAAEWFYRKYRGWI